MPSLSLRASSRIVADSFALAIHTDHVLVVGEPSDTVVEVVGDFPDAVDVRTTSDLVLSVSGAVHTNAVPAQQMLHSAVTRHLHSYLKANADQLGLNAVSDVYTDDPAGVPKFTLTPSRSLDLGPPPRVMLLAIHVSYIWKPCSQYKPSYGDLFSPRLLLPFQAALDEAAQKFARIHLVRCYPLIFGPWRKKLDLESHFFPLVSRSLLNIIARSQNHAFRKQCKEVVKRIRKQVNLARRASCIALHGLSSSIREDDSSDMDILRAEQNSDIEVLCAAWERVFRAGIRPPIFKGVNSQPSAKEVAEDVDTLDFSSADDNIPSANLPCLGMTWDDIPKVDLATPDDLFSLAEIGEDESDAWSGEEGWPITCETENDLLSPDQHLFEDDDEDEHAVLSELDSDEGINEDGTAWSQTSHFRDNDTTVHHYELHHDSDNVCAPEHNNASFETAIDLDSELLDSDENIFSAVQLSSSSSRIQSRWSSISVQRPSSLSTIASHTPADAMLLDGDSDHRSSVSFFYRESPDDRDRASATPIEHDRQQQQSLRSTQEYRVSPDMDGFYFRSQEYSCSAEDETWGYEDDEDHLQDF